MAFSDMSLKRTFMSRVHATLSMSSCYNGIFLPAAKPASLMDQKWTPPCKIVTCRGQRDIGTYIIEAREFDSQLSSKAIWRPLASENTVSIKYVVLKVA